MKKYIGLIACLALFVTLQAPSSAKPDDHGHAPDSKPPIEVGHKPSHDRGHGHGPHMQINYRYNSPCHSHHRYDCFECCNRPPHGHPDGFFGGRLGFTIFL